MTIDEYVEVLRLGEDTLDNENLLQIAKWLEELKVKRNIGEWTYKQGYSKAIDDFVELCLKHKSKDDYPIMCFDEFTIKKFAEQLKDGVEND